MSYYRSYFNKNNTILQDSKINTAKNPATEIFYGSSISKFLFKIDLSDLQSKINNGDYVLDENTKHTLYLTNTIFGDEAYKGQRNGKARERTTSFDLIIFPIEEYWDEGVGFDFEKIYDYTTGNETFDIRPSNWFNRTTLDTWAEEGVFDTIPSNIIKTIHFDNGDENISADITEYINTIISGGTTNYGLGLCFDTDYFDINNEVDQSVAFFTKYTQTFFEPFLETTFDDVINDDRENFIVNVSNNLYFYISKGTNYYDLDTISGVTVDILDSNKTIIPSLSGLTPTKIRKGVYKITFGLSGDLCDEERFFYDKWKGLSVDGISIDDVTQKFIPKSMTDGYTFGENNNELDRYTVNYFGIKSNEKIKRGDIRKISTTFKSYSNRQNTLFNEVYYRIYIKEGKTQINVYDWTKMDKTNENSFMLDTSYMIPREYWIEIKGEQHNEIIFYENDIKFEIVSEK